MATVSKRQNEAKFAQNYDDKVYGGGFENIKKKQKINGFRKRLKSQTLRGSIKP